MTIESTIIRMSAIGCSTWVITYTPDLSHWWLILYFFTVLILGVGGEKREEGK